MIHLRHTCYKRDPLGSRETINLERAYLEKLLLAKASQTRQPYNNNSNNSNNNNNNRNNNSNKTRYSNINKNNNTVYLKPCRTCLSELFPLSLISHKLMKFALFVIGGLNDIVFGGNDKWVITELRFRIWCDWIGLKPWPNGLASRRMQAFNGHPLALIWNNVLCFCSTSNSYAILTQELYSVWPPNTSRHKLIASHLYMLEIYDFFCVRVDLRIRLASRPSQVRTQVLVLQTCVGLRGRMARA